jgi:hypothetical protein
VGSDGTPGGGGQSGSGSGGAAGVQVPVVGPDESPDAGTGSQGGAPAGVDAEPSEPAPAGCTLIWNPSAMRDGQKAFELAEMPDVQLPGGSGPTHGGVKHIAAVAEHDAYRIDSHYAPPGVADFDRLMLTGPIRTDRLRCETSGIAGPDGNPIAMVDGETWRLTWSFYLPASLKGTSRFTHIMQLKYVDTQDGVDGAPIVTLSLLPDDKMDFMLWLGGGSVAPVDASGLHDKWITADLTIKLAPAGNVHWVLKDGAKIVVDKQQGGVTWPADGKRLRPKWGIYRGVADGVVSTYLMLADLKAWKCQ